MKKKKGKRSAAMVLEKLTKSVEIRTRGKEVPNLEGLET